MELKKTHFSLLFFDCQYFTQYVRDIYSNLGTYRKHSFLVNCISNFLNTEKNIKSFLFFDIKKTKQNI